ncbi:uncharacterized protein [Parasteatoda tepidariorum]|uniref:uncharacterized protein n=1 Tax=Parasteatoda tepidariorum TaxID=114398 RepID=UPI001C7250CC|nr:uncharacterized protein LOC107441184 [Parasteatoda tepidariorum]XP_015909831.2 uncharacterized protein LOC107441184 [Parasteatoda tepidariorum]
MEDEETTSQIVTENEGTSVEIKDNVQEAIDDEDQIGTSSGEELPKQPNNNTSLIYEVSENTNTRTDEEHESETDLPTYERVCSVQLEEPPTEEENREVIVVPQNINSQLSTINPNATVSNYFQYKKLKTELPDSHYSLNKQQEDITRIEFFREFFITCFFLVGVFAYAIFGAYLFSKLEQERDVEYNDQIDKWKNDTAILLATELRQVIPHEEIWARKVFQHLEIFERDLLKASAVGYKRREDRNGCQRWSLENSFAFSMSLITTTGFGAMTPRSDWGRTAAVCYSLMGVPIMMTCLYKCGLYLAICWMYLFHLSCPIDDSSLLQPKRNSYNNYVSTKKTLKTKSPNAVAPIMKSANGHTNHAENSARKFAVKLPCETQENQKIALLMVENIIRHNPEYFPHLDVFSFTKQLRNCVSKLNTTDPNNIRSNGCCYKPFKAAKTIKNSVKGLSRLERGIAIVFALLLFVLYIMCGSVVHFTLGVPAEDSLYLNYLMFSTLGSGCHVLDDDITQIITAWKWMWPCYLFFGYCILAMIFHLFHIITSTDWYFWDKKYTSRIAS